MSDVQTLPGALAAEIARVSTLLERAHETERLLPGAQGNLRPLMFMLRRSLDGAMAAANSPDIEGQARALEDLRGYSS